MIINLLKTISYKLSQVNPEERIQALKDLNHLDGFKMKQTVAAMTEVYVGLEEKTLSEPEAKGLMKQIEKDLKGDVLSGK